MTPCGWLVPPSNRQDGKASNGNGIERVIVIRHCNGRRKATAFFLRSNRADIQFVIVTKATCPACKRLIMEHFNLMIAGQCTAPDRIKVRHYEEWEARINSDLEFTIEPGAKGLRETRAIPLVSDYTKLLSLPADQAYKKILERVS